MIVNVTKKKHFYSNDDDCKTARDDDILNCHVDLS